VNGAVLVAAGAVVGAPARYLTDRAVQARWGADFPWGTLAVNALGSLVLGLVTGAVAMGVPPAEGWGSAASGQLQLLVGTGFCGALTTYSTFSYETLRLLETGTLRRAAANVAVSLLVGLTAVYAGAELANLLF
jgi:CrcB protein